MKKLSVSLVLLVIAIGGNVLGSELTCSGTQANTLGDEGIRFTIAADQLVAGNSLNFKLDDIISGEVSGSDQVSCVLTKQGTDALGCQAAEEAGSLFLEFRKTNNKWTVELNSNGASGMGRAEGHLIAHCR